MKDPILVVMAAGMGSRYGGLKQIDPVGLHGEIIIEYSLYDAYLAGFRRVVFIIKKENADIFREWSATILTRLWKRTMSTRALTTCPTVMPSRTDAKSPGAPATPADLP